jgi:hypothetical protein
VVWNVDEQKNHCITCNMADLGAANGFSFITHSIMGKYFSVFRDSEEQLRLREKEVIV